MSSPSYMDLTVVPLDENLVFDVDHDTMAIVDDGNVLCILQCGHSDGNFEDRILCLNPDDLANMIKTLQLVHDAWSAYLRSHPSIKTIKNPLLEMNNDR